MELQKVVLEGETFIKNAEDALARAILSEDQLYVWDNQVEVIDLYLADTEDVDGQSPEVKQVRTHLRDLKNQLEKKSIEFLAKQDGQSVPEDGTPDEVAAEFEAFADEVLAMANDALKAKVKGVDELEKWEQPFTDLSGFLADTEPYKGNKKLAEKREKIRKARAELKAKIDDMMRQWRESDLAGGEAEEDEE